MDSTSQFHPWVSREWSLSYIFQKFRKAKPIIHCISHQVQSETSIHLDGFSAYESPSFMWSSISSVVGSNKFVYERETSRLVISQELQLLVFQEVISFLGKWASQGNFAFYKLKNETRDTQELSRAHVCRHDPWEVKNETLQVLGHDLRGLTSWFTFC